MYQTRTRQDTTLRNSDMAKQSGLVNEFTRRLNSKESVFVNVKCKKMFKVNKNLEYNLDYNPALRTRKHSNIILNKT